MAMDLAFVTQLLLEYKYLLMLPAAIIEGPILTMVCGLLVKLGRLSLVPTFLVLAVGDLLGDALWYWLGNTYGYGFVRRFGKFVSITEERVEIVKKIFHKYHIQILLVSKVTMGLGFPGATLFTAGLSKIPFWSFIGWNALGQIIWTGMLLGIGYYLGEYYVQVDDILGRISIIAIILIVFAALLGFSRYVRNQLTQKFS